MASTSPTQYIKFPEEVIIESQCVFQIEKFLSYEKNEVIYFDEVKFAEIDVSW